jgi:SAM-dependent methyltransferase
MDTRETAPSAERNKQPILEVLTRVLPPSGLVLEIGSGTGQHVAHFAQAIPELVFQPTEVDAGKHASIAAWVEGLPNVRPTLALDVTHEPWPLRHAEAIVCINVIHISRWEVTLALMRCAGEILPADGVLVTYGPYRREGRHTAPSNETFDSWLKERDELFGVRDLEEVAAAAKVNGLALVETVPMPANNFTLVFRKVVAPA